jgi:hypothetical protein
MSTENRWEEERDITPRAVEDIWGRGYEDRYVMHVREKYFWIVELLRNKPNEKYFVFDPARHVPLLDGVNPGQLNWNTFDDWDMYRSSSDMIRQGIALLNKYYYNSMQKKYSYDVPVSDADLQEILKIIDCFGGVFGLRPAMQPYISDEWEIRPMERRGKETLTALVRNIRDSLVLVRRNEAQWRKDHNDCLSEYDTVMSVYTLGEKFGKRTLMDDWSYEMRSYVLKASERVHWQMTELTQFITLVLSYTGSQLEKRPILNYRN